MDLKQISIMGTYSMYKFYKGEKENPFADKNEGNKAMFWEYEFTFDSAFFKRETYLLHAFFEDHDMGDKFISLLSESDKDFVSEKTKEPVFKLWLQYLFEFKVYPEYGGENKTEYLYYSY